MLSLLRALALLCLAMLAAPAHADDVYYRIPLTGAGTPDNPIPEAGAAPGNMWSTAAAMRPYAVAEGAEVYIGTNDNSEAATWWMYSWSPANAFIAVRATAGAPVKGTVFVPDQGWKSMAARPFVAAPADASPEAKDSFLRARLAYDERMLGEDVPGAAFFRRRADDTRRELGMPQDLPRQTAGREITDTYDLFTGGRAVSENLQLYREMPGAARTEPEAPDVMVKLANVPGITIAEFDWKARLASTAPALDSLSAAIPADQHAVFFPSFAALMTLLDQAGDDALPVARTLTPRSEDANLSARYERQLCLQRSALSRLLGPSVIKSVAVTGSDPYFPTGTDVAVIFEALKSDGLRQILLTQIRAAAQAAGEKMRTGEVEGIAYEGATTPDRALSSFIAALGDNVIVTNSLAQLAQLARVHAQKSPALSSLPEFRFFRSRYPLNTADETAFIFLSDATIRRWCGAEWRIAASRRLRAAAILADVTAANAREIVEGARQPREVKSDIPMRTIGTLTLNTSGISSSVYGNSSFLTPIRELALTEVPKDEADAYARWRDGYQRNWSWAFDPIGISLSVASTKLAADITVMPLIGNSDYQRWVNIARGASIGAKSGDPHETLAHFVMAINPQSPTVQQFTGMARMMAPQIDIEPLAWLGSSVALYADPDPFWSELAAAEDPSQFFEQQAARLPVALNAEVGSALKLTAFVAAARGFIDQSAPGMTAWEPHEHNGRAYVSVGLSPTARAESRGGPFDNLRVHYAATPRALIVTLNEDLLKRALDRQSAERAQDNADKNAAAPLTAAPDSNWLGTSAALRVTRDGLSLVRRSGREALRAQAQRRAWSNLAALNEWRRMFPQRDAVTVHRALFGTTLLDPGNGTYKWNADFATMESTVYGHPGAPKEGPDLPGAMDTIDAADFGLSFEDGGVRARAVVKRSAK